MKSKRPAVASGRPKLLGRNTSSELSAAELSPQELLERVKELAVELRERPVVIGPRGALILDAFKHVEDFIANYRENIKELLESEPHAIPGYHLESQNRNVLSRNAALVYEKLAALVELSAEDFLAACTPSIGGLTKLLETHEGMLPEEINHTLEQALGNQQLLALEITHRLVREREDRP